MAEKKSVPKPIRSADRRQEDRRTARRRLKKSVVKKNQRAGGRRQTDRRGAVRRRKDTLPGKIEEFQNRADPPRFPTEDELIDPIETEFDSDEPDSETEFDPTDPDRESDNN